MPSGELALASNLNSLCMFTNPLDDLESWYAAFCRPHLPMLSDPQFFKHFQVETEFSLQSRAHFSNLIFQKWSVFFSDSQVEIEVSLSVSCAFCPSHLPKVFPTVFFYILKWKSSFCYSLLHILPTSFADLILSLSFQTFSGGNRALATVLCTFCRQLSQIVLRNRRNRDPPSATAAAT